MKEKTEDMVKLRNLIAELQEKIAKDTALLEREARKNQTGYNSAISGARHRILLNGALLEQYQRMLRD